MKATPDSRPILMFRDLDEVTRHAGKSLGTSDWYSLTQDQVDTFADTTHDHQWIHTDVERAAAGPFGGTIAHGYLTLALLPHFSSQVYSFDAAMTRLNYGLNSVRFLTPVRPGNRLRDEIELAAVEKVRRGTQLTFRHHVGLEAEQRPALVAETITLVIDDQAR